MSRTNDDLYDEIVKLRAEVVAKEIAIQDKIDRTYLRIQVFEAEIRPLRKFVYGLISIAGGVLVTAIVGLVVITS